MGVHEATPPSVALVEQVMGLQVPALHASFVPQVVPLVTGLPLSMQTETPSLPLWVQLVTPW